MNVYQKLNEARDEFHQAKLKKSGHNKFANYYYFELGDFLIPALKIFAENDLCAIVSFDKDIACMSIVDIDKPDDMITLTSPMGSAALKGCHEVQNIGAVETYQRRYLWVAALEIIEQDALDSTTERDKTAVPKISGRDAMKEEFDSLTQERQNIVMAVVNSVTDRFNADDVIGAYDEYTGLTDNSEKMGAWYHLPSNVRTALTKHKNSLPKD